MTDPIIKIEGFEELLKALKDAPQTVLPYLKEAMTKSVRAVQARVAQYPPSSEANQPGRTRVRAQGLAPEPMGYYERGRGWWYPVLQKKTLGDKIGVAYGAETAKRAAKRNKVKNIPTVAGYKLAAGGTSEMLGRSWDAQVITDATEGAAGVLGLVGTNTSYADYVQGGRQAQLHEARGWKTVDQALEESKADIDGFFGEALEAWMKREIK